MNKPITDMIVQDGVASFWYMKGAAMRGDVDVDGKVNIDDVTALINMLLSGNITTNNADVDRDGRVNIDDVTTLIGYLLAGHW